MDTIQVRIPVWNLDKFKKVTGDLERKGNKLVISDFGRDIERVDNQDYLVYNYTVASINGQDLEPYFTPLEFNANKIKKDPEKFSKFLGFNTIKIIYLGIYEIKANGYVSASYENSTKDKVIALYNEPGAPGATGAEYKEFMNWVKEKHPTSDYERTAKGSCLLDYCQGYNLGYILSFIQQYYREKEREAERAERELLRSKEAAVSEYLGKAGDHVTFKVVSVKALYTIQPYAYNDDWKTAYRIINENGNIIIWKTPYTVHEGDVIKATIKSTGEYRGEKQTTVIRGKIIEYGDEVEESVETPDTDDVFNSNMFDVFNIN